MTEGFSRIDQELCTGCGSCVSMCPAEAITGERHKPHTISEERCVGCGRCVQVCSAYDTVFEERATLRATRLQQRELPQCLVEPLFAAYDHCYISIINKALADPDRFVMAECGPAVAGPIAEDFGLAPGSIPAGSIVAALKKIGFAKVYDSTFPAALAIGEEAHELAHRLQSGGTLPLINSSCPAAVKFIEQSHPELIYHLASCKSPHMITGALMKSRVARLMNMEPARVFSVSIGPCTSRKFEAGRPEMNEAGIRHLDAVLTARELAYMIKAAGIDIRSVEAESFDQEIPGIPEMDGTYCVPGDISEAVLRAARSLMKPDGQSPVDVCFAEGGEGIRTATVQLGTFSVKTAAAAGLTAAAPLFDAIKAGTNELSFLELLACPMGCVSGGGQPKVLLPQDRPASYAVRSKLYSRSDAERCESIVQSPAVRRVCEECFGKAPGDKSNRAVHTQYEARKLSH